MEFVATLVPVLIIFFLFLGRKCLAQQIWWIPHRRKGEKRLQHLLQLVSRTAEEKRMDDPQIIAAEEAERKKKMVIWETRVRGRKKKFRFF